MALWRRGMFSLYLLPHFVRLVTCCIELGTRQVLLFRPGTRAEGIETEPVNTIYELRCAEK